MATGELLLEKASELLESWATKENELLQLTHAESSNLTIGLQTSVGRGLLQQFGLKLAEYGWTLSFSKWHGMIQQLE